MLSFCENFRRQFVHLYRDRKPLFLNPLNESGIEVIIPELHVFLMFCLDSGVIFEFEIT